MARFDGLGCRLKRPVGLVRAKLASWSFFAMNALVFQALLTTNEPARRDWHALRFKGTH